MRALLLLSALCLSFTALADDAKPLRIAVVDVRTVIQKSPQLAEINRSLTEKFKPREQNIVEAQVKYKAEQEKLDKNGQTMADADRSKLEHEVINDRANLQAMITSFQQDLDNEQNAAMQKLLGQVGGIVSSIAKDQHYDLILQGDNVAYVSDPLNITDTVLKKLSDS